MIRELTDIIVKNWEEIAFVGVIASAVYGGFMICSGLYETVKTNTAEELPMMVIGTSILGAAGMSAIMFAKYLHR